MIHNRGVRWKSVRLFKESIPHVSGVYAVYCDGSLTYVGQSADIADRLMVGHRLNRCKVGRQFHTPWGVASRVVVKYRQGRRYGEWAMAEMRLIWKLRPPGNRNPWLMGAKFGMKHAREWSWRRFEDV